MHIAYMPFTGAPVIRFNKREITALEAAARIAERARALATEDSDLYVDMAQAEHGCRFLIEHDLTIE